MVPPGQRCDLYCPMSPSRSFSVSSAMALDEQGERRLVARPGPGAHGVAPVAGACIHAADATDRGTELEGSHGSRSVGSASSARQVPSPRVHAVRASRPRPIEVARLVQVADRAHRSAWRRGRGQARRRQFLPPRPRAPRGRSLQGRHSRHGLRAPGEAQPPARIPERQAELARGRVRGTPTSVIMPVTASPAARRRSQREMCLGAGADRAGQHRSDSRRARLVVHDVGDPARRARSRRRSRRRCPRRGCATRRRRRRRSRGTVAGGSALPWPHRPSALIPVPGRRSCVASARPSPQRIVVTACSRWWIAARPGRAPSRRARS